MPGNVSTRPLATLPVPESGSKYDIIVVGAGVLGSAFAFTFGKQGKRVLLLERNLSEPDRIVGEMLQPGGCKALRELGLADCLEGIDAVPLYGYGVIHGSEMVQLPYLPNPDTGKPDEGRSFHHGRFIQNLRTAASQAPNVTVVEATVNEILRDEDGVRVVGVTCSQKKDASEEAASTTSSVTTNYFAPLTVIADGCFSKFRKQFTDKPVVTTSHTVGLILKDVRLPLPNHGHLIIASPLPIALFPISSTDTRMFVNILGKLPSASSGALRSYLENVIHPQLPATIQKQFLISLETERLRTMPCSFLPPSKSFEMGVILLGDAMNMRHPSTASGMTVALNDVVHLKDMLDGDVTQDQEETMVQMELFFWKRKKYSSAINVLAEATNFIFSLDCHSIPLRDAIFSYFKMSGEDIAEYMGLLSGINNRRRVLAHSAYAMALHLNWYIRQVSSRPLATLPVPESGSKYDIIVVGAGVLGSAFAFTFGKQGKRVLLLERNLSEPDRIVGEQLQPGGCKALRELGLADCLKGIDAMPLYGCGIFHGSDIVQLPYLPNPDTGKPDEGRSFHHGRFIQKLRTAASQAPNVTVVEATVNEILRDEDGVRVVGVTCSQKMNATEEVTSTSCTVITHYFAPLTVIADGCFSKFRKQFTEHPVATTSHAIGLIMKDVHLPLPNHSHIILASPSPIVIYQISLTETRIFISIPGKLPCASSGALRSYLEVIIQPQLPVTLRKQFSAALETERLRTMPISYLPPSKSSELGVILLGDAMNMRHPLTGGGMTVALNDVVYLKDMLNGDVTQDQVETMVRMELFFWKRKKLSTVINVLAETLFTVFSREDENSIVLRDGALSYFKMGGECIAGPVGLISGIIRHRKLLAYHLYAVALHSIWLMFHRATWAEVPMTFFRAFSVMWTACVVLLPVMWGECKA
ncbi:Squalene epoxidase [Mortierella alpina]|nr:Squalene epoxidase [Mortierella alpina]